MLMRQNRFYPTDSMTSSIQKAKDEDLAFELQLEEALQESLREQDRQTVVALRKKRPKPWKRPLIS